MLREGDADAGFELVVPPIPPALRPFVASWTGYAEWTRTSVERVEVPTGRAVVLFEFGPPLGVGRMDAPLAHHGGFFAGADDAPAITRFQRAQAGVQVNLTVSGALAFARAPLARSVVALSDLGVPRSLGDRLAGSDWSGRFRVVSELLLARIRDARRPSPSLLRAVQAIDASHGVLRIDALSEALGHSRKHLHALFVDGLGLAPKQYARVRRASRALELVRRDDVELARLAFELGYADQSHLTRELRRITGSTPRRLADAPPDALTEAIAARRAP